jgi:hypothetical protein
LVLPRQPSDTKKRRQPRAIINQTRMPGFPEKITRSNFFIKLKSWEYWPFGILQFPVIIYWLWLSLRARTILFFSASNPGIPMGGMFGESKADILNQIPAQYIPKTSIVRLPVTQSQVLEIIRAAGFSFPVIFKPDLGERGFMVRRIRDEASVEQYLREIKIDFIIQELVELPHEFGVFYQRYPSHAHGKVTSIVMKEMLIVTGDGRQTLRELILSKDRAKLQWEKLKIKFKDRLGEIVPKGECIELVSIGNHALGTKFLNGNHLIIPELSASFDRISKHVSGFYFGRFDLRCQSIDDLTKGNVKIVELNGCGAEPAHIYDPDFKFAHAVVVLFKHWRTIFEIARENHKLGVPYVSLREAYRYYRRFKDATGK